MRQSHSAFTVLELLITIGILGVLFAVSIPAVLSARNASHFIQCTTRLKQIGIAIEAYSGEHGSYPTARLMTGQGWSANAYSLHSYILPFLDDSGTYDLINFDFTRWEGLGSQLAVNSTVRSFRPCVFLCPAGLDSLQRNSYRYNTGLFREAEGPFRNFHGVRPGDVTDGLHSTAFVSERIAGSFSSSEPDVRADIAVKRVVVKNRYEPGELRTLCNSTTVDQWYSMPGRHWFYIGTFNTSYNHNALPNDADSSCEIGPMPEGDAGVHGPRSHHDGGVNVLFGDGHVSFISNTVDSLVWRAVGTMNDGDL